MDSNNLVPEDVVTCGQVGGDIDGPRVVVGGQVVRGPSLVGHAEAALVDLDPRQTRLVERRIGALAAAQGDVRDDGPRVRPRRPLELDGAACADRRRQVGRLAVQVADDVAGVVGVRGDEAVVKVLGPPSHGLGECACVFLLVVVVEREAAVVDAVGDDA